MLNQMRMIELQHLHVAQGVNGLANSAQEPTRGRYAGPPAEPAKESSERHGVTPFAHASKSTAANGVPRRLRHLSPLAAQCEALARLRTRSATCPKCYVSCAFAATIICSSASPVCCAPPVRIWLTPVPMVGPLRPDLRKSKFPDVKKDNMPTVISDCRVGSDVDNGLFQPNVSG